MKAGYKTTEFSMAWLMTAVSSYGLTSEHELVQAMALIAIGMVGLGYQLSRGIAKKANGGG